MINPIILNTTFIAAVLHWLSQFPNSPIEKDDVYNYNKLTDPYVLNNVLRCILDENILDYSDEFEDYETNYSAKLSYFEKLINIIDDCYFQYNTNNYLGSWNNKININNIQNSLGKKKRKSRLSTLSSSNHTTKLKLVDPTINKNSVLNYYIQLIDHKKLVLPNSNSQKSQRDEMHQNTTEVDLIQLQILCSILAEAGLHCKKNTLAIALISFLEVSERDEFNNFLIPGSKSYNNDTNSNSRDENNEPIVRYFSGNFPLKDCFQKNQKDFEQLEHVCKRIHKSNEKLRRELKLKTFENLKLKIVNKKLEKQLYTNQNEKPMLDLKDKEIQNLHQEVLRAKFDYERRISDLKEQVNELQFLLELDRMKKTPIGTRINNNKKAFPKDNNHETNKRAVIDSLKEENDILISLLARKVQELNLSLKQKR
ncbi:uncharacterized protein ASCRUDRAFT_125885 [Ascoidea rubescens DSM 1968]|uniref:HOOK N-terminal domain-containing protein n=1 Tax=Ascoidea rubescens DSM 1968 TaxID=1344418 RepID=A0A1D2VMW8_9ASCO|nr:hypothetical protein ASCRUDRAFT_125885 [Ascoidea rubescens DSM 1968]ODV62950.1 hypothetical protein ASCRUDRAFT_125885 [Ascoidea rubescens DSM 1968]